MVRRILGFALTCVLAASLGVTPGCGGPQKKDDAPPPAAGGGDKPAPPT